MNIRNSWTANFLSKLLVKVESLKAEYYLFFLITAFYFLLWIFSPSYKLIAASFVLLPFLINIKFRNFRLSFLLAYLASALVFIGKTYLLELIPPGIYDPLAYPDGYLLFLVINPGHILVVIMFVVLVRDIVKKEVSLRIFNARNLVLLAFFLWLFVSDIFGSRQPDISLASTLLGSGAAILYFYLQAYVKNLKQFFVLLVGIFSAFIFFESIISWQQYVYKAPVYKSLEYQGNIEPWGKEVDELEFTFRPVGTFHHANSLGSALVFWLTIVFVAYIKTFDRRVFYILILGFVTLALTLSRSAWLGLAVSALTVLFVYEKIKKLKVSSILTKNVTFFILALPAIALFVILPRAQNSIYTLSEGGGYFRFEQVTATLKIISAHPIFGVGDRMVIQTGLEEVPESIFGFVPLEVHNWYLLLSVEHGLPAFIIFMIFILLSVRPIILRVIKGDDGKEPMAVSLMGGLAAFLIIGMFQAISGEFYILSLLGLLNSK